MAQDEWSDFGFVYGRSGTSRGTTTSSGVLTVETGFSRKVIFALAEDAGNGLRNNNADPAATTGVGTFAYFRFLTTNPTSPTTLRLRVFRDHTLSAASSVSTLSRRQSLATVVSGIECRYLAFGY